MMKKFKKFLLYVLSILGVIVLAFGITFAVLYFGKVEILGYKYVTITEQKNYEYSLTTDLSVEGVTSLKIQTNSKNVFVRPNSSNNAFEVKYTPKINGIANANYSEVNYKAEIQNISIGDGTNVEKTLVITLQEPEGTLLGKNSNLEIYLPSERQYVNLSATNGGGNLQCAFDREIKNNEGVVVSTLHYQIQNVFLSATGNGNINIKNASGYVNLFDLKTENGGVAFNEKNNYVSANKIKFSTNSGSFNFTNGEKTAYITVTDCFEVVSNNKKGPQVRVNNLFGKLIARVNGGNFAFNKIIGQSNTETEIGITASNLVGSFGQINGKVAVVAGSSSYGNKIYITKLIADNSKTSYFDIGKGLLSIQNVDTNLAIDSLSGAVSLDNINPEFNVDIATTSGDVNLKYIKSSVQNNSSRLKLFTYTGNVTAKNISVFADIKVFAKSSGKRMDLSFTAVCFNSDETKSNIINAYDRKINIKLIGLTNDNICRVLANRGIAFSNTLQESIVEGDDDFIVGGPAYQYRINYQKPDAGKVIDVEDVVYNQGLYSTIKGKLTLNTTNNIAINCAIE